MIANRELGNCSAAVFVASASRKPTAIGTYRSRASVARFGT
jgi:hypothetical protein